MVGVQEVGSSNRHCAAPSVAAPGTRSRNFNCAISVPAASINKRTMVEEREVDHILLVDDEDDCNFVTKLVLKKAGYTGRITCFTMAEEALDHMRRKDDMPDLMFVDINMPRVNGFQFLEICESEELLPNGLTSVVMFSSSNRPADLERALSFRSVQGYVEKALSVDSFERVLNDHRQGQRA